MYVCMLCSRCFWVGGSVAECQCGQFNMTAPCVWVRSWLVKSKIVCGVCFLQLTIPGEFVMSATSSVMSDVIIPTDQPLSDVNIQYPTHPSSLSSPTNGHYKHHYRPTGFFGRITPRHTDHTLSRIAMHPSCVIIHHNPIIQQSPPSIHRHHTPPLKIEHRPRAPQ